MNSRHCTPVSNLIKLHIRLNLMKFIKLLFGNSRGKNLAKGNYANMQEIGIF